MKLSILMPVYNERTMIERCLAQVLSAPLPENLESEVIIVDDRSTDGTWDILQRIAADCPQIKLYRHEKNQGKGAAVRTAIQKASGDYSLIQDADLEYDPHDYPKLLKPLLEGHADAVFGSRYMAGEQMRVLPFWHSMINKTLTTLSNMFCNLKLTDMETCYKAYKTDILKSIPIRSDRFGIEPELTMKSAKRKLRIYEVPISYHGRTYEEGKKIGWKDGVKALATIVHFWVIDDLYVEPYGRGLLNNLTGTPQYLSWVAGLIRPHLGDTVIEIGAGIGHMTGRLMGRRLQYVACEKDPLYLHALRNRFLRTPNVCVRALDPACQSDLARVNGDYDTLLCVNVLEYLDDAECSLKLLRENVKRGGRVIVLAPHGPGLMGRIDRTLGHRRRYSRQSLTALLQECGFRVEQMRHFNKAGAVAWWSAGALFHRKSVSKITLKAFDKTVWFWRRVDPLLPWHGLSLIAIATRTE